MTIFYVTVSSAYSVEIADSFVDEHKGNHDALADEIADAFFSGDCSLIDERVMSFEPVDQSTESLSF